MKTLIWLCQNSSVLRTSSLTVVCSSAESSLCASSLGGGSQSYSSSSTSTSSSAMGFVSKKAKKEFPVDLSCMETDSELPSEDESKYPEDLEDKMKGGTCF